MSHVIYRCRFVSSDLTQDMNLHSVRSAWSLPVWASVSILPGVTGSWHRSNSTGQAVSRTALVLCLCDAFSRLAWGLDSGDECHSGSVNIACLVRVRSTGWLPCKVTLFPFPYCICQTSVIKSILYFSDIRYFRELLWGSANMTPLKERTRSSVVYSRFFSSDLNF